MEVKRTWKRAIAFMLALAMAFTFIPNVPALAANTTTEDIYADVVENGTFSSASCYYGDSGTYTKNMGNHGDNNDHYLKIWYNGGTEQRSGTGDDGSTVEYTIREGIKFTAYDNCDVKLTIPASAPAGTYRWELWDYDDETFDDDDDLYGEGTFTIYKRPIIVKAEEINKYFGEDNKVITYNYSLSKTTDSNSGLAKGDTVADVCTQVYASEYPNHPASTTSDTVNMSIHMNTTINTWKEGAKAGNYAVTFVPAKMNIAAIPLDSVTVDFGQIKKTYDGQDFTGKPTFTYNGKTLNLVENVDYTMYWKKEGTTEQYDYPNTAGNYTAIIEAKAGQDNVTNSNKGFKYTIEKKAITIAPKDQEFTFDGETSAKIHPADDEFDGVDEVLSGGKNEAGEYKNIDLVPGEFISDYYLIVGDDSDKDRMFSTWVADPEDTSDNPKKVKGTKEIVLPKESIVITRESDDAVVTDCYDITVGDAAKLTINPKEVVENPSENTQYYAIINDEEYTYDGKKHTLGEVEYINSEGNAFPARDLTVEYSVDGGETWTTKTPSYVDAGVYEIYYRIAYGAGYKNGYPNADEFCNDLLFSKIEGSATLTIKGAPQTDATVSVSPVSEEDETPGWTYGDDITGKITVTDSEETDITDKTDFTGESKEITYRYVAADDNITADNISELTAGWTEFELSEECVIPAGDYWLEATIPAYASYEESKVYTRFTVEKKAISVGLNRFNQTIVDEFEEDDYNDPSLVDNSEKYTYDGLVGEDTDPLDLDVEGSTGKYSDVKIVENEDERTLEFVNEFDGDPDIFDNYIITVVDQIGEGEDAIITDGLITLVPVDIADTLSMDKTTGKYTGTAAIVVDQYNGPYYVDEDVIYAEWTGKAIGPKIKKVFLKKTKADDISAENIINLTADVDYTVQYFKLDDEGMISVKPLEGLPTDKGDYVLVVKGNNVEPGSDETPVNEDAKVYGTSETRFSITDRTIVMEVQPKDRAYEFANKSVEMDLTTAELYTYNNLDKDYTSPLESEDELRKVILADENVKNITGEMEDDSAGDNKDVIINGGEKVITLATEGYESCKVILRCSEGEGNECKADVNIAKASLKDTTFTIGGKEKATSWQYGDFEKKMADVVLTPAVQSATIDGETVEDPTFDNEILYYYAHTGLDEDNELISNYTGNFTDDDEDDGIETGFFRTSGELQEYIKSNKNEVGKTWIKVVVGNGKNYYGTTLYYVVTVNKRNITITANEQYRYYMDAKEPNLTINEETPDFTITHVKDDKTEVNGKDVFVTGDSYAAVVQGEPSCDDVTSLRTLDAGDYEIINSTGENALAIKEKYAGKYELEFNEGVFKILPLPLDNVYDDEEHPQISEGYEVKVRLEKSEYVYDGKEKTPMFTVVYTDGETSYTIPQEQYQYYYTKADESAQSTVKAPDKYNVYVYKANGKNNLEDGHTTRGEFEITKIPVTVRITMSSSENPEKPGSRTFDGTTTISGVKYTTELLYKPSEDGGYAEIPATESLKELKENLADGKDADYKALLDALELPSANAGLYFLGTDKDCIDVTTLNDYLAEQIDDDTHEYCLDDVIYEGIYEVKKAPFDAAEVSMETNTVEYNGKYQKPEVTVTLKLNGKEVPVTENDILVTYSNNKAVSLEDYLAVATVSASPNGNFIQSPGAEAKTVEFTITPKVITLTSNLSLKDKVYDGIAQMDIIGDYEATDFITDEDATLKFTYNGADDNVVEITKDENGKIENNKIDVSDKNVGEKTATITVAIDGDDKDNYTLKVADKEEDDDDQLVNRPAAPDHDKYPLTADIEVTGEITVKDVSVVSTLALKEKVRDGKAEMEVTGTVDTEDFISDDDVRIAGADDETVTVKGADAGQKSYTFELSLEGEDKDNYNLKTESVTATGKIISLGTLSSEGIYCMQNSPSIKAGMNITKSNKNAEVEYRWEVYNTKCPQAGWIEVNSWSKSNQWINYTPDLPGDYLVVCHARIKGDIMSEITEAIGVPFTKPVIKATCQMPSNGNYLIGFETFDNPGNQYSYEILILDCNLLALGKDPWIFSTGKKQSKGNSLWTSWDPKPGYYWTLFRVYDKYGNVVEEQCYGFNTAQ